MASFYIRVYLLPVVLGMSLTLHDIHEGYGYGITISIIPDKNNFSDSLLFRKRSMVR